MPQDKQKRVTLTKAQAASSAGGQLLSLLVDLTADGELSLGEIEKLRVWLDANHAETDVPAVSWLRELITDILADGRVTSDERIDLIMAIERVMPKDQRLIAVARRQAAEGLTRETEDDKDDSTQTSGRNRRDRPATEPQCRYILALGGKVTPDLSVSSASELIDALLAGASSVSNRQMMVLRFWNHVHVSSGGRCAVSEWMDIWYAGDPDRQAAWNLWKEDNGDVGHQDSPEKVPLGDGERYLQRVKTGSSGHSSSARMLLVVILFGATVLGTVYVLWRVY